MFGIGGSPPSEETTEKNILPSGYAGGPTIFFCCRLRERKSRENSPTEIISLACPSPWFLVSIQQESRVQASNPEGSALATFRVAMSSNPHTISQIE